MTSSSPTSPNALRLSVSSRNILALMIAPFRTPDRLAWIVIVLGITFRVIDYSKNRPLWMDETFLLASVADRPIFEFDRPLAHDQLAAPGFLVAARTASRVLGTSRRTIRFMPLVFGIASLFLLRSLARRTVARQAVPVALAIAAMSDDLIYYSSEFKQYSCDLLTALACSLLALQLGSKPLTSGRLVCGAALGALATWFSFPAIFVLAAGGIWLAGRCG